MPFASVSGNTSKPYVSGIMMRNVVSPPADWKLWTKFSLLYNNVSYEIPELFFDLGSDSRASSLVKNGFQPVDNLIFSAITILLACNRASLMLLYLETNLVSLEHS